MNKEAEKILNISIRYVTLILLGLLFLDVFYRIFSPLTIYPVYFLMNIFYDPWLFGNLIILNGFAIEIIEACIAPSAYYLFLILTLSIPEIKIKKRLNMLFLAFLIFLILNILRIFFLSLIYVSGYSWFDFTHKLFWYLFSTVFVVGIWFWEIKKFNIKGIPFYSDLKFLYKNSYLKKLF